MANTKETSAMNMNGGLNILKGMFLASVTALLLAATGCGPDCAGFCNDTIDICDRQEACAPDHCDQLGVTCIDDCDEITLNDCLDECDGASSEDVDAARAELEKVASDLTDAGC
jgi:hypothetical protein